MGARLYVGNLSYGTTETELRDAFAPHGNVVSATVVTDRETGRSRGFGFVELGSDQEARAAIDAMNGAVLDGRSLTVNEARERTERGPRGGGGGGGGGGGDRGDRGDRGRRSPRW
jgi:RNA recognition motif-containing protein